MIALLTAAAVAFAVAMLGTPLFIRFLVRHQYGQFIRQDGPATHMVKRGTPTMGGVVIIGATVAGWLVSALIVGRVPGVSAILVIGLMVGLGLVGFADDFTKIRKERSLGLSPTWKVIGQGIIGISFSVLALQFRDQHGRYPASMRISFLRDTSINMAAWGIGIGVVLFIIWANFLITAWSNAVNLTDGLDGLATGASLIAFGAYIFVGLWQVNQDCAGAMALPSRCYDVRDPYDLAIVAAAIAGACCGFLWWNASPAKIFMGDTGSLALGGAYAAISILSRTEVLAVIIGGLFFIIVMSDVIQIGFFKATGRRVFKMAPLHHHFELLGWPEVNIVVRFWLIAGLCAALGLGLFYGQWVVAS
ncbi:phospho-N-acetylmuramoyl-pentapeptide-transferase [Rarobacter incanus]|uniref:Phospho-N-acetylmuramoyl-pentapeptide-transferase n=1 Tax=Rarobacter incanus TaxID=153494 RepID=A0A542SLH7_9MICO|nr:phospho-N-acetylmuramoyl-pentapeptide-transferase [Rarobacter incanus]TQK75494.1 phospho-N-acetylmuramoyl-pentapeptide-transferase [Rarobacter incanus]